MALSTKTLDALNDSRKTEPHKYIWGQFTPDKEGVGYTDLPEQTDIPDDAKLVLDVNGPSLVTASITSIRGGLSGRIATTEKAGIVKPDGTTISVSSDGTISSSAGLPVGTVFISDLKYPEVPSGALEYNGTEIPGADELYPDFWNRFLLAGKMNTGSYTDYETAMTANGGTCPFFALDVENKRFKTPTWADGVFTAAATTEGEINKYYNAGLPNITGTIGSLVAPYPTEGAFTSAITSSTGQGGSGGVSTGYFDASKSNAIYGASDTVTPKHVRKRWFVQVANAVSATSFQNIDSALAAKQDKLTAGANITIKNNVISATTGGSSTTEAQWGQITGTLSEQTDLQNVLDTIPTKTSQLTNDSGYIKRVPHASSTTYGTVKVVYDSATKTLNIIN